jgi:hypothetical protein
MIQPKQHYVAGSNVPGFFWGTDFYPNSNSPDDTDFSSISGLKHVQFRNGESGTVVTCEGTAATHTVDDISHSGLQVSAADMAKTLTVAGEDWQWRFEVDLMGDSKPCYSEWKAMCVY